MDDKSDRLPAGKFSDWLAELVGALETGRGIGVPCGSCTACCRSSQFIHVERSEEAALSRIPREHLFQAPDQPRGNMVMGYDRDGHCPMLTEHQCSIYPHRPKTCRNYDCRIFAAAGIEKGAIENSSIAAQAARWVFEFEGERDREQYLAIREAAAFLRRHPECFNGNAPSNMTHLAVMAVKVHRVFLRVRQCERESARRPDDQAIVEAIQSERLRMARALKTA